MFPKESANLFQKLASAMCLNDFNTVSEVLQSQDVNPNHTCGHCDHPLLIKATYLRSAKSIELLLTRKDLDLDRRSFRNVHALHIAAYASPAILEVLLRHPGFDVNVTNDNITPLIYAIWSQRLESVELLLEQPGTMLSGPGNEPLGDLFTLNAPRPGLLKILKRLLLDPRMNLNLRSDSEGHTILHRAILGHWSFPRWESVKTILREEAVDPTLRDRSGRSAKDYLEAIENVSDNEKSAYDEVMTLLNGRILEAGERGKIKEPRPKQTEG